MNTDPWPYCRTCMEPISFDPQESLASCKCHTTKWRGPRPDPYAFNPHNIKPQPPGLNYGLDEASQYALVAETVSFQVPDWQLSFNDLLDAFTDSVEEAFRKVGGGWKVLAQASSDDVLEFVQSVVCADLPVTAARITFRHNGITPNPIIEISQ